MEILNYETSFYHIAGEASGYPKSSNPRNNSERMRRLSKAPIGSGHDCCMKGISVFLTVQADHSWWLQCLRYHFIDVVSSQSKMHSITKMELVWNKYVERSNQIMFEALIQLFKEGKCSFERLIMNCPMGLMLKAGLITNYLQLKTIYSQRKNHKMESWLIFCDWIKELPHSYLITGEEE